MTESSRDTDLDVSQIHTAVTSPPAPSEDNISLRFLQLHPVALRLTLLLNAYKKKGSNPVLEPIQVALNLIGATLGSLDSAPLNFQALVIEDFKGPSSALILDIISHYQNQVFREAYKVIGSLDILGNPLGLIDDLGSGVKQFFYEPSQGMVHSPQEFGKGLARGSLALVSTAAKGLFTSASKITSILGKGFAVLSLDDEYVSKRIQENQKRKMKRRHRFGESVLSGGAEFGKGALSGLSGIILDPILGAQRAGVSGLVRGVGTGFLGFFVKPIVGLLDLFSWTFEGVASTAKSVGFIDKIRPSRYLRPGLPLMPLDLNLCMGVWVLDEVDHYFGLACRDEEILFVDSVPLKNGYVVLTSSRLCGFVASSGDLVGKPFSVDLYDLVGIYPRGDCVIFTKITSTPVLNESQLKFHVFAHPEAKKLAATLIQTLSDSFQSRKLELHPDRSMWTEKDRFWMNMLQSKSSELPPLSLLESSLESCKAIFFDKESFSVAVVTPFRAVTFSLEENDQKEALDARVSHCFQFKDPRVDVSESADGFITLGSTKFFRCSDPDLCSTVKGYFKERVAGSLPKLDKAWIGYAEKWTNVTGDIRAAFDSGTLFCVSWESCIVSYASRKWMITQTKHLELFLVYEKGGVCIRRIFPKDSIVQL